jgi:hypothetical protein
MMLGGMIRMVETQTALEGRLYASAANGHYEGPTRSGWTGNPPVIVFATKKCSLLWRDPVRQLCPGCATSLDGISCTSRRQASMYDEADVIIVTRVGGSVLWTDSCLW